MRLMTEWSSAERMAVKNGTRAAIPPTGGVTDAGCGVFKVPIPLFKQ